MAKSKPNQSATETTALTPVEVSGLPSIFNEPQEPAPEPLFQPSPYVSFVSLKGPAFPKIAPLYPNLKEGEPVLFRPEPYPPLRLDPFRFFLVKYKVYYGVWNDSGELLASSFDGKFAKANNFGEAVETVVLVFTPDGLVPARCTFKTTKTKAVWSGISALAIARDSAAWGKLSPDHVVTLQSPIPCFRFTVTVNLTYGVKFTTGRTATVASGLVKPAGVPDWHLMSEAMKSEKVRETLTECADQHDKRVAFIASREETE